jgi:NAD(P)-dependent dehydrogenase (short-subunit alcohol dehydrogenase family)
MTNAGTASNGKVALITGAGKGIGAETARELTRRGAKVGLLDVDEPAVEALAAELGEDRALAQVADVTDQDALDSATAAVRERFGGIDVVMANAGIASYGTVSVVDPDAFARVMDINVTGVFRTVRAALPSVIERHGYVLVVCSLATYAPSPGLAAYCASKAGAEHFANSLRLEVAHQGVDVGSAHMSWIDTPLVRDAERDLSSFGEMRSKLPGPMSGTTSVEACARAFVRGIEKRSSRIWVPGWVRFAHWLRPLLTTRVGEREVRRQAGDLIPRMDAEVAALGRSLQAPAQESVEARERVTR